MENKLISMQELCDRWHGCSRDTVNRHVDNGDFPTAYHIMRGYFFLSDIEAWEEKNRGKPAPTWADIRRKDAEIQTLKAKIAMMEKSLDFIRKEADPWAPKTEKP